MSIFQQQFSTPRNAIPSPGGTFDVDIQTALNFGVGNDFRVRKQASCTARTDGFPQTVPSVTSACHAVIDPMFDFDQTAFDAMLGARSFLLDDSFEFEFRPNLALASPIDVREPTTIAPPLRVRVRARLGAPSLRRPAAAGPRRRAIRSENTGRRQQAPRRADRRSRSRAGR